MSAFGTAGSAGTAVVPVEGGTQLRRPTLLILLLGLALSLPPSVAAVDPASTDTVEEPTGDEMVPVRLRTEAEAIGEDLSKAAQALGWSTEQASAYVVAEREMNRIGEAIGSQHADVFIGTAIADDPLDPPVVFVKGPADPFVLDLISHSPIKIDLRDNQPYSLEELRARQAAVDEALATAGFDFSTYPDIDHSGTIQVEVVTTLSQNDVASVLPVDFREGIRITIFDEVQGFREGAFGGMRTRINGTNKCTSGFTVEHLTTGSRGVASAHHCTSAVNQIVHFGHAIHAMTFQSQSAGPSGDFQWLKTNQPEADDFFSDAGVVTDVTSIETVNGISLNELVCAYGAESNNGLCVLRTQELWVTCSEYGSQIRMNGNTQILGDSGGPWYREGRAYGIHGGGCTGSANDHFSMVDLLDNTMNVAVQTN